MPHFVTPMSRTILRNPGLDCRRLQLWERQPDSVDTSTALGRRLFDFYFMRLVITVTPLAVTAGAPLQRPGPIAPSGPGTGLAPARNDRSAWAEAVRRLPRYSDAVLGTSPDGGLPVLRRVRVTAGPRARHLHLDPADGGPVPAGAEGADANLLLHGHDDRIDRLRQFGLTGRVTADGRRWILTPERFVPGSVPDTTPALALALPKLRRATRCYLDDRGLSRPRIAWDEFARLRPRVAA
jgi:hypothetical protein